MRSCKLLSLWGSEWKELSPWRLLTVRTDDKENKIKNGEFVLQETKFPWFGTVRMITDPIQWVPAAPSLWVKLPGREADHSPPSSAGVCVSKNEWSYTSTPPIRLMAWGVVLS
jgi:hypothetical protein